MSKLYSVISHTHWDREWYQPFESFRLRLVQLMDNLLETLESQPEFRFHLDAQSIVLEDYLEIKPQNKERIKRLIADDRLLVGPWYVQNDFFLTSGEATVRNILIGVDIADQFGKCAMVGYAPDQFGLTSQLPQIFSKSGINSCIFGRGYTADELRKSEFWWKSEDGSKILGVHLPYWYNNAQRFPKDIDISMSIMKDLREKLELTSTTNNYLLMNGVDHLEAQEDLLPILSEINKHLPDGESIFQDTMLDYIQRVLDSVGEIDEYLGEMRNGPLNKLLTNTLSSRVYLKQENVRSQYLLEAKLEPIYSLAEMLGLKEYPREYMRYIWKLLIQNHPHDSICGCSADSVHDNMMDRFKRIHHVGTDLLEKGAELISSYITREGVSDDQYLVTLYNTNSTQRSSVVEVDVYFPEVDGVKGFTITDESGVEVPYIILSRERQLKQVLSPINLPGTADIVNYRIQIWVEDMPGLSYRTLIVTPSTSHVSDEGIDKEMEFTDTLENEYLLVTVNPNGTIDLFDKKSNKQYNNLLRLEDREDIGDAYIYRASVSGKTYTSADVQAEVKALESNSLSEACLISYSWDLPLEYDFATGGRSSELHRFPVEVKLTLRKNSKWLDVSVLVENTVKDHRLRLLVPTGSDSSFSQSGSPFDVLYRDRTVPSSIVNPSREQPNTDFVNVDGVDFGIAVLNEGLYEYEHLHDDEGTIALTLFRGNDYLFRRNAAPIGQVNERWRVPENQCLGQQVFRLAIYPHKGDVLQADVAQASRDFLNPVFGHYQSAEVTKFSGGRPFVQGTNIAVKFFRDKKYSNVELPLSRQLMHIQGDDVILSTLKKSEARESFIVRLYNTASEARQCVLSLSVQPKQVHLVDLLERRVESLAVEGYSVETLTLKPKEIVTVEVVL